MPKKKEQKQRKKCVRTIKRYSRKINLKKWLLLLEIARAFAKEKDHFLGQYNSRSNIYIAFSFRKIRTLWVARKHKSYFGLQNRQWKLALKDSCETMDKYWAAISASLKASILKSTSLTDEEKHFLLKVLTSRRKLHELLTQGSKFELKKPKLTLKQRKHCVRFLKKLLKKTIKKTPRVKIARSFLAEPETYRVFYHNGRQYIAITTKEAGQRVIIPLTGDAKISGQIRVVLDFERQRVEIHQSVVSKIKVVPKQKTIGIDLGITEVFTDSDGDRWGIDFGKTVENYSDKLKDKGKKRNKLHSDRH